MNLASIEAYQSNHLGLVVGVVLHKMARSFCHNNEGICSPKW